MRPLTRPSHRARLQRRARLVLFALMVLCGGAILGACEFTDPCTNRWQGPIGGAWENAANWTAGVPTAADIACGTNSNDRAVINSTPSVKGIFFLGGVDVQTGSFTTGSAGGKVGNLRVTNSTLHSDGTLQVFGFAILDNATISTTSTIQFMANETMTVTNNLAIVGPGIVENHRPVNLASSGTIGLTGGGGWAHHAAATVGNTTFGGDSTFFVGSGGSLTQNAGTTTILQDAVQLLNRGTTTFRSTVALGSGPSGARISNEGTLNLNNGTLIHDGGWFGNWVKNETSGVINTNASGSAPNLNILFENDGVFNAQTGNVILGANDSSTADAGTYDLAAGATITVQPHAHWFDPGSKITGAGTFVVDGNFISGTINDEGVVEARSSGGITGSSTVFTVAPTGRLKVASGQTGSVQGAAKVDNAGTVDLAGYLYLGADPSDVVLDNSGLIELKNGSALHNAGWNNPKVNNLAGGTVRSTSTTTAPLIYIEFENDGLVDVQTGDLRLSGGNLSSTDDGGEFRTASGATTTMDLNQRWFASGSKITGAGAFVLDGRFVSGSPSVEGLLEARNGGGVNGSTSVLTVQAAGRLKVTSGQTAAVNGAAKINNLGTIDLSGYLYVGADPSAATLDNSGLIELKNGSAISNNGWSHPKVNNKASGTVRSNSTTTPPIIYIHFQNEGAVNAQTGDLRLSGGNLQSTSDTGTYQSNAGAKITMDYDIRWFSSPAKIQGPGKFFQNASIAGEVTIEGWLEWESGAFVDDATVVTVAAAGKINVPAGSATSVSDTAEVDNNGTWEIRGNVNLGTTGTPAHVNNDGTLNLLGNDSYIGNFGWTGPTLVNSATGSIHSTGPLTNPSCVCTTFTNNGAVWVDSGGLRVPGVGDFSNLTGPSGNILSGGTWELAGALEIYAPTPVIDTFDANVHLKAGSAITDWSNTSILSLTTITANGTLTIDKAFNISTQNVVNAGTVTVNGSFQFRVNTYTQSGGTTTLSTATSSLRVAAGAGGVTINGGVMRGLGTITGSVLVNGGSISAGPGPGRLQVSAALTETSGATTDTEIGGLTPITQYDQLAATGAATVGGTLNVTTINGFTPSLGDSFTIVTGSSLSGTYSTVNAPALGGGLSWSVSYTSTSVVLTIV